MMDSPKKFQRQVDAVRARMESGETLTTIRGFETGVLRTASRMYDIKKSGTPVYSRWIYSGGRRIKEYSLTPFTGEDSQLSMFGEETADA